MGSWVSELKQFRSLRVVCDTRYTAKSQIGVNDDPTFTRGPEYFSRFRPPNPAGSVSTRSDSKRSSVHQVGRELWDPYGR